MSKSPPRAAPTVLVVEDEPVVALDLQILLEALGCEVLGPAQSVSAALRLLETEEPGFALLDVNLGRETAAPVGAALSERGIPFATATASATQQIPEPLLSAVCRLQKPLSPADLHALLISELVLTDLDADQQNDVPRADLGGEGD